MTAALQDLVSIYFSFNIAYPRPVYLVLLFLQHHVFGIKDNQTVPNIVKIVYGAMCAYLVTCLGSHSFVSVTFIFNMLYGSMRVTV